ncbi:hypothetical protein [Polymorphospora lycopeni]|uniref:Uncharacterized protein n=1 Tax=Polymorphospora lycopeni TaxID=3140240 RepID=A0ABV5CT72_9ACTN
MGEHQDAVGRATPPPPQVRQCFASRLGPAINACQDEALQVVGALVERGRNRRRGLALDQKLQVVEYLRQTARRG